MRRFMGGLIVWVVLIATAVNAEDAPVSFKIAPPPVGYPILEADARYVNTGVDVVYATVDTAGDKITFYGATVFGTFQQCLTNSFALIGTAGGALIAGDKYELVVVQIPLSVTALIQPIKHRDGSFFLFGGIGGDVGVTAMTVTVPQPVPYTTAIIEDDTRLSTTITNGAFTGGAQLNIPTGPFIVSLFGVYHYTGGSYSTTQTSNMSYDYPSYSGSIENSAALSLGCDLLYTPLNLALSSQLRNTDDYTLVSVGLKWLYSRVVPGRL